MTRHRAAAEAIGTFMLVVIGPGAAAVNAWSGGGVSHVGVALAFGFVILAAVYTLGHISGAHFNPAVTIAFSVGGRFPARDVPAYIAAQLTGAVAGALLIRAAVGEAARASATTPAIAIGPAALVEITLTFFLMLVVMAVATDGRVTGAVAGTAVGLIVACDALMGGLLTGASMNPARSFGPAVANGVWTAHWLYWLCPIVGAIAAVYVYDYLRPGTAHDYRHASPSRSLPLHGELRAQSDSGSRTGT